MSEIPTKNNSDNSNPHGDAWKVDDAGKLNSPEDQARIIKTLRESIANSKGGEAHQDQLDSRKNGSDEKHKNEIVVVPENETGVAPKNELIVRPDNQMIPTPKEKSSLEISRERLAKLELGKEGHFWERKKLLEEEKANYQGLAVEQSERDLAEELEKNPDMTDEEKNVFFATRQGQMWNDVTTLRNEIFKGTDYGKVVNWLGEHKTIRTLLSIGTGAAIGAALGATGGVAALAFAPAIGLAAKFAKGKVMIDAGMSEGNRNREKNTLLDAAMNKIGNLPPVKFATEKIKGFVDGKYQMDLDKKNKAIDAKREAGDLNERQVFIERARAEYEASRNREKVQRRMSFAAMSLMMGGGAAFGAGLSEVFAGAGVAEAAEDVPTGEASANGVELPTGEELAERLIPTLDLDGDDIPDAVVTETNGVKTFMVDIKGEGDYDTPMLDLSHHFSCG
jgi:hypothetical protein